MNVVVVSNKYETNRNVTLFENMSQFYQKVTKLQNNLFDNSSQKIHLHICLLTSEIIYIASSNRLLKPQESKTNIKVFTICVHL